MKEQADRYELKFIFDEAKLSHALHWMETLTSFKSSFPTRLVNSLYFDDISYQSVRDNLAGIAHRQKNRLRWYGDTSTGDINGLAMELKIKNGRLGHKKIFPLQDSTNLLSLTVADIGEFIESSLRTNTSTSPPPQNPLVFTDYLIPTLLVEYSRDYFEDNKGIRITIDSAINFRSPIQSATISDGPTAAYPFYILEIKFPIEMKYYVSNLIRPLHFIPKRHSKYLTGLSCFGIANYI